MAYEGLTLRLPQDGRPLLKNLSVSIPYGTRVLIAGANEAAKVALFRATAGLWTSGAGRIICPGADGMLWLAERPYLPPGTLREISCAPSRSAPHGRPDPLYAGRVEARSGPGSDRRAGYGAGLGHGAFAERAATPGLPPSSPRRATVCLPGRPDTALSRDQVDQILQRLSENSISYLTIGDAGESLDCYDAVLEIADDGGWTWKAIEAGKIVEDSI